MKLNTLVFVAVAVVGLSFSITGCRDEKCKVMQTEVEALKNGDSAKCLEDKLKGEVWGNILSVCKGWGDTNSECNDRLKSICTGVAEFKDECGAADWVKKNCE